MRSGETTLKHFMAAPPLRNWRSGRAASIQGASSAESTWRSTKVPCHERSLFLRGNGRPQQPGRIEANEILGYWSDGCFLGMDHSRRLLERWDQRIRRGMRWRGYNGHTRG